MSSLRSRPTTRRLLGRGAVLISLTAGLLLAVAPPMAETAVAQASASGQSRCGTLSVVGSPVVKVGETVEAEAKRGSGWTPSCGATWAWGPAMPVGRVLSGCDRGDKTCKIKTTQATGTTGGGFSFLGFCIQGTSVEWESCATYAVVLPGALIEGSTKSPQGVPVPGVRVQATGPGGKYPGLSGSNGEYVLVVTPGTYTVAPISVLAPDGAVSTLKTTFDPVSVTRTAVTNKPAIANFTVSQPNTLTIQLNPAQVAATGLATVQVTITDMSPGNYGGSPSPVAGAKIIVEPPIEVGTDGVPNGLLCNSANNKLVSPLRLHDGTLLGTHFWATTNSLGEVVLTLYVGTLSGKWVMDAYQPGLPGAPLVSASVDVASVLGRTVLDGEGDLLAQLISAGDSTLLQKGQSLQRNVLEWLGEVDPQLQSVNLGVGYAPIFGVDASGATNAGVVIFAPSPPLRSQLLDYLDGVTKTPPNADQAWVIDIGNLSKLLATGEFTGNRITHVQYRLPSLQVWEEGEKVIIARGEDKAIQSDVPTLVPVAGRVAGGKHAQFGLVGARGNESMLYGYGPYLPAPSSSPEATALSQCLGA